MNASKEDKLGMLVKCQLYITNNAVAPVANPFFTGAVTQTKTNVSAIVDAASTATRNLMGFTASKANMQFTNNGTINVVVRAGFES